MNTKMKKYGTQSSIIRNLFEYGLKRKKEIGEDNVFDFSIGNPSVSCPKSISDALIHLVSNEDPLMLHSYSTAAGYVDSKEAIVSNLNSLYGTNLDSKYVYLTPGASAALVIALHALLKKDDEVIAFTPFFPEYKVFVNKAQGKLIKVKTNAEFYPDLDDLKRKITKKTKVIIINSPNNPTGVVYHESHIQSLCAILQQKEKKYHHPIYLISDEPYREIIHSNHPYPFITKYYKNSLVAYSFSKSVSLPGERIGYLLLNNTANKVADVFASICGAARSLGYVCEPTLFQKLIPYCLKETADLSVYKENRDVLYTMLKEIGYEVIYPEGAFYLFVKALDDNAVAFMEQAKKYELLLVPSDSFGIKGYVRVSYCVSLKQIKNAYYAFLSLYKYYRG